MSHDTSRVCVQARNDLLIPYASWPDSVVLRWRLRDCSHRFASAERGQSV